MVFIPPFSQRVRCSGQRLSSRVVPHQDSLTDVLTRWGPGGGPEERAPHPDAQARRLRASVPGTQLRAALGKFRRGRERGSRQSWGARPGAQLRRPWTLRAPLRPPGRPGGDSRRNQLEKHASVPTEAVGCFFRDRCTTQLTTCQHPNATLRYKIHLVLEA